MGIHRHHRDALFIDHSSQLKQQTTAIQCLQLQCCREHRTGALRRPLHVNNALGFLPQLLGVRAIRTVNGYSTAAGDKPENLITWHRSAAFGQFRHHIRAAFNQDTRTVTLGVRFLTHQLTEWGACCQCVFGIVLVAKNGHEAVSHMPGGNAPLTYGGVQCIHVAVMQFRSHGFHRLHCKQAMHGKPASLHFCSQSVAAQLQGFLAAFLGKPLPDLRFRPRRDHKLLPVLAGTSIWVF